MAKTPSTMLALGDPRARFCSARRYRQDVPQERLRRSPVAGDVHLQPLSLRPSPARRFGRFRAQLQCSGFGHRRHQLQRHRQLPRRRPRQDGARKPRGWATRFRTWWMPPNRSRTLTTPPAPPIFSCSMPTMSWCIVASTTPVAPATANPSPAPTSAAAADAVLARPTRRPQAAAQHWLQHQVEGWQRAALFRAPVTRWHPTPPTRFARYPARESSTSWRRPRPPDTVRTDSRVVQPRPGPARIR